MHWTAYVFIIFSEEEDIRKMYFILESWNERPSFLIPLEIDFFYHRYTVVENKILL